MHGLPCASRMDTGCRFPSPPPLQCFPSEGPQLLAPALQRLLADLLAGRESGLVAAAALGVYARVLLQNAPAFLQLFQASSCSRPQTACKPGLQHGPAMLLHRHPPPVLMLPASSPACLLPPTVPAPAGGGAPRAGPC